MKQRRNSRDALLNAAETVILKKGVTYLTLDAVACQAGTSKGGILYHFPNKQTLLEALLDRRLNTFDQDYRQKRNRGLDDFHAYLKTCFEQPERKAHLDLVVTTAFAFEPNNLAPARAFYEKRLGNLADLDDATLQAAALTFSIDGLWYLETLGLLNINPHTRERLIQALQNLAKQLNNSTPSEEDET